MALYLDGQNIISGGGGSGGHTIVDAEGVSLEQRTNLQFKGAYSEDNSTDDTTEVNVVREMTKAEFDLLSDDEKVGIINITDITGSGDDRFQPVVYSFDEREIGVWTDGKPLYEKTFVYDDVSYSGSVNIDNQFSGIDTAFISDGFSVNTNDAILPIGYAHPDAVNSYCFFINAAKTGFGVRLGTNQTLTYLQITLRYTKTADTAGSGQWTPQGVPAVHYSTDEQVIGTWVDGSALYEKTIPITNVTGYTGWVAVGTISGIDTMISGDVCVYDGSSYSYTNLPINFVVADGTIAFYNGLGGHMGTLNGYATIRYTKSSS